MIKSAASVEVELAGLVRLRCRVLESSIQPNMLTRAKCRTTHGDLRPTASTRNRHWLSVEKVELSRFCSSASEADVLLAIPAFARRRRCFNQRVKWRPLDCEPCSHAVNAILMEPTPRLAQDLFRSLGARTAATDMSHTGLALLSRLAPSFFRIPSDNASDAA